MVLKAISMMILTTIFSLPAGAATIDDYYVDYRIDLTLTDTGWYCGDGECPPTAARDGFAMRSAAKPPAKTWQGMNVGETVTAYLTVLGNASEHRLSLSTSRRTLFNDQVWKSRSGIYSGSATLGFDPFVTISWDGSSGSYYWETDDLPYFQRAWILLSNPVVMSTSAPPPVPLPASVMLLPAAFGTFAFLRRRKHHHATS